MVARGGEARGAASRDGDDEAPRATELRAGRSPLGGHAFVFEDVTAALTIDDVRGTARRGSRPLAVGGESGGHSRSAFWLWFRVKNTTAGSSFIIDLGMTSELAELYDETGARRRSGSALPFGTRDVVHASMAFRVTVAPGAERTFWVRQRTSDTVRLDPEIWSEAEFWDWRTDEHLLDGLWLRRDP